MELFWQALTHLHSTLLELGDGTGKEITASQGSLDRLRQAAARLREKQGKFPSKELNKSRKSNYSKDEIYSRQWTWEELEAAVKACEKCAHLVRFRTQVVFGVGNRNARLMFVGEAPGAEEDLQGEPFVGRAGELLTKMIQAMGLSREEVYIGNVLKCRPDMPPGESGNRKPKPEEMRECFPWLHVQIRLVKPEVMVALGATAAEGLLGKTAPMKELRGRWFEFEGIPTIVTYHPAYLLRNQALSERRKVWEDLMAVMERLGMQISEKQRSYFLPKSG